MAEGTAATASGSGDAADEKLLARCRANWEAVQAAVHEACHRAGRAATDVRIIGVTKYIGLPATRGLLAAGCLDLGESRPQSLWTKAESVRSAGDRSPRWHLIGHLQRNKVAHTLQCQPLIHTVDSLRLLEAIEAEAVKQSTVVDLLLEVNLAGDAGRTGLPPPAVSAVVEAAGRCRGLRILGLMGMASHPEAGADARREFARLRELRDRLVQQHPGVGSLEELSMGMSGDFEEAILEGATMVRIGSALTEGLEG
jgi:pyridoxal phosphate enzyme (YggS family)